MSKEIAVSAGNSISFDGKTNKWLNLADNMEFIDELKTAYPHVDLHQEFVQMKLWLEANPKRRKKNYKKFITNWLSRSNRRKSENITYAERTQNYRDQQADKFYEPLANADEETLKAWGLA